MRVFMLILAVLALAFAPVSARGDIYLRVVADSDAAEAQRLKLLARDAALAVCADTKAPSPALIQKITRAVSAVAPCDVALVLWSPPDGSPPAPTIRVTLGSGGGRNWWGVLYEDSIDFFIINDGDGDDAAGEKDTVAFKWTLWECIRRLFGW